MKKLYFAYGSNLFLDKLELRAGKVRILGPYSIYGWKLAFNAGVGQNCFANIIPTGKYTDVVEGMVYELTDDQLGMLDDFEGAPQCYTRMIQRFGSEELHVYAAINPNYQHKVDAGKAIFPSKSYIQTMLEGAKRWNLKRLVALLEAMEPLCPEKGFLSFAEIGNVEYKERLKRTLRRKKKVRVREVKNK